MKKKEKNNDNDKTLCRKINEKRNKLHVMSSRLDCDAETILPLYGLIIDAGPI